MALYTLADLHLATDVAKPMDIFGGRWEGHTDKIIRHWRELIAPEDVVSWGGAMTADEMHATTKDNCLADSSAFFLSFCPMYWEQTIVPPAASA